MALWPRTRVRPDAAPAQWAAAKARIDAGTPGPATSVHTYDNWILASQQTVLTRYSAAQNELSTLIGSVKDSLGVANIKAEKMDQILTDAITGRYEGKGTASVSEAQIVINAIHEAYPDMTPLDTYDQVITTITAGRQSFKDQQNKLLDMLRDFETFRKAGLVHRQVVKWAGLPDDTLRAAIGQDVVYGTAALERMNRLVLTEGTVEAYETGVMPDLVPDPAP